MFLSQFAKNYRKNLFSRILSVSGDFGDGRRFIGSGLVWVDGIEGGGGGVQKNAEEKKENP